ncbi:DUF6907 domain-containing protein [Plantactinospora sp. WMMB334]|uniref:DUF6907 domain-containing protein n=1 Tax=Plantactinospora sp. WMMB334 TaxID=3404119 RepID=UPI003B9544E1
MTAAVIEPGTETAAVTEPEWCRWQQCAADALGDRYHMSAPEDVPTDEGTGLLDVALARLDDVDGIGKPTVSINLGRGGGQSVELTAAQTLHFAEVLRRYALRAAGRSGVEMPIGLVRVGEEIQTDAGWDAVEGVDADGWCCGRPMLPVEAQIADRDGETNR